MKNLITTFVRAAAVAGALAIGAGAAQAAEPLATAQPGLFSVGAGYFDLNVGNEKNPSWVFDVSYVPDYNLGWNFRPLVGAFVNTDGGVYGHVGFSRSVFFTENLLTRFQVGFGFYGEGDSKDLGQSFEFREQVEIGYAFDSGHYLAAYFYHLSNAGIAEDNPGVNSAGISYSVPW